MGRGRAQSHRTSEFGISEHVAIRLAAHWLGWTVKPVLLDQATLPTGFHYPPLILRLFDLDLTNLEPWWLLDGDLLRVRYEGLRKRYPGRVLVPFAVREDRDDVACLHVTGEVEIVHDFASPGYERRQRFGDAGGWLRQAIQDLIDFEA